MQIVNEIIYYIFPLLFAGLIHHLVIIQYNWFAFISKPIDGSRYFRGNPLLGESKTWRGLLAVPILSSFGSLAISRLMPIATVLPPLLVGFLLGLGYALAELPNSFIKRRFGIQPGGKANNKLRSLFLTLDQIDSVLGAILVVSLIERKGFILYLSMFIIGSLLHLAADLYLRRYGYKQFKKISITRPDQP